MNAFKKVIKIKLDEFGRANFNAAIKAIATKVKMPMNSTLRVRIHEGSGRLRIAGRMFDTGTVWGGPTDQYAGGDTADVYEGMPHDEVHVLVTNK